MFAGPFTLCIDHKPLLSLFFGAYAAVEYTLAAYRCNIVSKHTPQYGNACSEPTAIVYKPEGISNPSTDRFCRSCAGVTCFLLSLMLIQNDQSIWGEFSYCSRSHAVFEKCLCKIWSARPGGLRTCFVSSEFDQFLERNGIHYHLFNGLAERAIHIVNQG